MLYLGTHEADGKTYQDGFTVSIHCHSLLSDRLTMSYLCQERSVNRKLHTTQQLFHNEKKSMGKKTSDKRHENDVADPMFRYVDKLDDQEHMEYKGLRHDGVWHATGHSGVRMTAFTIKYPLIITTGCFTSKRHPGGEDSNKIPDLIVGL